MRAVGSPRRLAAQAWAQSCREMESTITTNSKTINAYINGIGIVYGREGLHRRLGGYRLRGIEVAAVVWVDPVARKFTHCRRLRRSTKAETAHAVSALYLVGELFDGEDRVDRGGAGDAGGEMARGLRFFRSKRTEALDVSTVMGKMPRDGA